MERKGEREGAPGGGEWDASYATRTVLFFVCVCVSGLHHDYKATATEAQHSHTEGSVSGWLLPAERGVLLSWFL